MMGSRIRLGIVLLAVSACELAKSNNPLSPSVAGPIAGVTISAPKPLEPNGTTVPDDAQPITLLIENATTTGQRPLTYAFEVATDSNFSTKVYARDGVPPGDNGRTSLKLPDALATGRQYYWRARAGDGANTGPYSETARFEVKTPVVLNRPTLLSPANNEQVASVRPTFRWVNATRSGPISAVKYTVEVSTVESFESKAAVWQVNEQPNQTSYESPQEWSRGLYLFWRVRASSTDGAYEGPWSDPRAFLVAAIVIGRPTPISPANNERVGSLQPTFVWENALRSGPAGPITYTVEVSDRESFSSKLAVWQVPEAGNPTRYVSPQNWAYDQYLFWRVRASDGTVQGDWGTTRAFSLPDRPAPAPPPVPSSPPPGGGGGTCTSSSPSDIVACERYKYSGQMSSSQLVDFLRAVARSLNRNGISGGPFGILRKNGGHNCHGYSCDVVCAGQGSSQRQWDVLIDGDGAQIPTWGEIPQIRADVCEIQ